MKPGIHIYYDFEIKEHDKVIRKFRRKGHSFVKQFSQFLLNQMGLVYLASTDTGGTSRTFTSSSFYYTAVPAKVNATATTTTWGLVVGSNNTAVTINDYALNTKIAHGTGAGQLSYSAMVIGAPTYDETSNYFVLTRVFTNGSGGSVAVNEIGLYAYNIAQGWYFCHSRDVLASTITLLNGQNLTLNYTIKATI